MTLADLAEMLGVPVGHAVRLAASGRGTAGLPDRPSCPLPAGRGRGLATMPRPIPGWLASRWPTSSGASCCSEDKAGRTRKVDPVQGPVPRPRPARRTARRSGGSVDAERRKAEIELELAGGSWRDPRRGEIRLAAVGGRVDQDPARPEARRLGLGWRRRWRRRCCRVSGRRRLVKISNGAVRVVGGRDARCGPVPGHGAQGGVRACASAWRPPIADNRLSAQPG